MLCLDQDATIGVFRMLFVLWRSRSGSIEMEYSMSGIGCGSIGDAAWRVIDGDVKRAIAYATSTCRAIRHLLLFEVAELRIAYDVIRRIVAKHADFENTGLLLGTEDAVLLASTKFFRYVHSFHTSNGMHRRDMSRLGERGFVAIAGALCTNTTLKHLCLDANNIWQDSDAGVAAIAGMLETNKTLKTLILSYQHLGPKGGVLIGHALANNTTLRTLSLRQAKVYNSGAIAIAEALKQNTTLTHLNLDECGIGVKGGTALVDALEQNTTLRRLSLQGLDTAPVDAVQWRVVDRKLAEFHTRDQQ